MEKITSLRYCPYFFKKRDKLRNINFTGEASKVAPFYALKVLWELGYFPPILVILEYAVVTISHIIEKEPCDEWFATHNSV